jgi:hypothetical protein
MSTHVISSGYVGRRGSLCRSLQVSHGISWSQRALTKRYITDQIKAHQQADTQPSASNAQAEHSDPGHQHHTYTILCTPRKTSLCRRVLEDLGVSGDVELREYRLEWIGMENDLLSLELESVAKDIYLVSMDESSFLYTGAKTEALSTERR